MNNADSPLVSIVVVPRQQFGILDDCLAALYAHTHVPFEVVVVHFGGRDATPPATAERPGLRVVETNGYLYPHASKNLGMRHISPDSRWVVFMDNDVKVHAGWLDKLLDAAVQERAGAVHPLYLFERRGRRVIHMAHGEFRAGAQPGRSRPAMQLVNRPLAEAGSLRRRDSDFVEFHLWLIRRDVLDELGPFDPVTVGEHVHHSLQLQARGHRIVFEPAAVVTYCADVDGSPANRDYLRFRWGHAAARRSVDALCEAWPEFAHHWRSKVKAAWEFRSANEPWYPAVGAVINAAAAVKHRAVGKD